MPSPRSVPDVGGVRRRAAAGVAALAVVAAVLTGCGWGGSHGKDAAQVPAPDATRCPAGVAGGAVAAQRMQPHGPAPSGPFLVDPQSQAAQQARAQPADAAAIAPIVQTSTAFAVGDWLGGDVTGEVRARADAATAQGATAVFMIYAIPHRDVGAGFSAGGLPDGDSYRRFTRQVAAGIGTAHAVIVLEPDALGQIDQLDAGQATERYALLNDAVDVYGALSGASVYLDGTNCGWTGAAQIAQRLEQAGVRRARGFAVNVANYYSTADEAARAEVVSRLTGGARYVVDTSRNGRGPAGNISNPWCNPPDRGLGRKPTTDTGYPDADAFLWVKTPGASDGTCDRNDPTAGTWWQAQAEQLVQNAAF